MIARPTHSVVCFALVALVACDRSVGPGRISAPLLSVHEDSRNTVVVNPNASGNGVAVTIQEGVDMAADGGVVLVMPGRYDERIVVDKGLTIAPIGLGGGPVILWHSQPTSAPAAQAVILIDTPEPVLLRDFTVHHDNIRGVNVLRDADLRVEGMTFEGVATSTPIVGNGVSAHYSAGTSGKRARIVVRDSRFSVGGLGISYGGDVDGVIENNEIRQSVSRLPCVVVTPVGQGGTMLATPGIRTDVEIRNNLFEDCAANAFGRYNMVVINGTIGASTTGTVNIIGNTFRHTTPAGCAASGILYAFYTGVIEHNTLFNATQTCSPAVATNNERGAIYVGHTTPGMRPADVAVRFNDFIDNEYAALRIGPNQPSAIDASCNWWGSSAGPSSVGAAEGRNAIVVQPGGATPAFTPVADAPIAGKGRSCGG